MSAKEYRFLSIRDEESSEVSDNCVRVLIQGAISDYILNNIN